MKRLVSFLVVFTAIAAGQAPTIAADRLTRDGSIVRGAGHVRIRVAGLEITADSGTVDTDTEDVEAQGHAGIVLPGRPDKNLIRHPAGAIVTADPVTIVADTLAVKAGLLLRGRGHVTVNTNQARLQADELDLFLRIADGEVRGNVLLNGAVPQKTAPRRFRYLPPEIWK